MFDHYWVLGVLPTASDEEIKKAYHRKIREYHPDINPGNKVAEEWSKQIILSYEIIGNPVARKTYDFQRSVEQYNTKLKSTSKPTFKRRMSTKRKVVILDYSKMTKEQILIYLFLKLAFTK